MNNAPIEIKTTVATWLSRTENPMRVIDAVKRGDLLDAVHAMAFYGAPDRETFGSWIRVGEADVTVRLLPLDDQVRAAVQNLKEELDRGRAEWLTKQQEIMERIRNLQAIAYEPADARTVEA